MLIIILIEAGAYRGTEKGRERTKKNQNENKKREKDRMCGWRVDNGRGKRIDINRTFILLGIFDMLSLSRARASSRNEEVRRDPTN